MLPITHLFEQDEPLPVEMVQNDDGSCSCICPHCGEEISQDEVSYDEENDVCIHDLCDGEIIMPDDDSEMDDDDEEGENTDSYI
jgi:hypothetical protein